MTKKFILGGLAISLLLTGCKCDEENLTPSPFNPVQQLSVNVSSANGTRGDRDLLSNEALQGIDKVKVFFVNSTSNEIVAVHSISNWTATAIAYNSGGNGYETKLTLGETGMPALLPDGSYNVYAFGYNSDSSSYSDLATKIDNLTIGTWTEDVVLTLTAGQEADEIFAGKAPFEVANGKCRSTVVLTRQVAGAYFYVCDIPWDPAMATANPVKLRLVTNTNVSNRLVLGKLNSIDLTSNGGNTPGDLYVNGFAESSSSNVIKEVVLYDGAAGSWFSSLTSKNVTKDGINADVIDAANWQNAVGTANATFVKGAVFGGTFLIPQASVNSGNTMTLQLLCGENVVKEWSVKLATLQTNIYTYSGSEWATSQVDDASVSQFNIVRNHLYSIGKKTTAKPDANDLSEATAEEAPVSLIKAGEITIHVNSNWEVIHDMVIQ